MCTACLQVFGLYLSTYIVVIISIDRCMAIMDPISKNRGPRRVKIMIAIAWILSAVFSVPQVRALPPPRPIASHTPSFVERKCAKKL